MISVLVVNTKGGCGKTTVATNLAAAFAVDGARTALADVDRQRSSLQWLDLRPANVARIEGLDWTKATGRPPKGVECLVIDAPAALRKRQVFELVAMADAIVVPILPSAFDQGSTSIFLAKLNQLKSIRKSRKPVAILRNRVRAGSRAAARLAHFLAASEHVDGGVLTDRSAYNEAAARGLSLFDLSGKRAEALRADWTPILSYTPRVD
jgi:chromosome partitioning protein